jgi:hypothetical protein
MEIKTLSAGVAMALGLWLAAGAASAADIIHTYDFSGTLANPVAGGTSVTGQFTLDQTTGALSAYSFNTPLGVFDTSGAVASYSPALSPPTDFIEIYLLPNGGEYLWLVFQTDLASFSGGSLYTGPVSISGGGLASGLGCFSGPPDCETPGGSPFVSGEATLAVPEPASWALILAGVVGLGGLMRVRRSRQAEQAI